jgi:hypothetical protein
MKTFFHEISKYSSTSYLDGWITATVDNFATLHTSNSGCILLERCNDWGSLKSSFGYLKHGGGEMSGCDVLVMLFEMTNPFSVF